MKKDTKITNKRNNSYSPCYHNYSATNPCGSKH